MNKKWKCTVCGYVQTGNEPPEKCPVCGSDRSQFIEVTEGKPTPSPETSEKPATLQASPETTPKAASEPFDIISRWIYKFHIHPMSVHIPNGLLPVSVFFVFLAILFTFTPLATASYFNMIFVLCAMPVVLYSGYSDWKSRFKGALTRVFKIKMACGGTVTLTALILVLWRTADPMILGQPSAGRWLFLLIHLIMLAAATVAGYYGGKLVFKDKR